jgi:hypothetical protein
MSDPGWCRWSWRLEWSCLGWGCCQAVVHGDPTPRARDQWLEVEGTWVPRPAAVDDPNPPLPVLKADLVRPAAPARPPYEYSMQFSG